MWTDIYLKANNQAELEAALPPEWLEQLYGTSFALDIPGVLYDAAGHPRPGYHANLRLLNGVQLPPALAALVIDEPSHPYRVFAG